MKPKKICSAIEIGLSKNKLNMLLKLWKKLESIDLSCPYYLSTSHLEDRNDITSLIENLLFRYGSRLWIFVEMSLCFLVVFSYFMLDTFPLITAVSCLGVFLFSVLCIYVYIKKMGKYFVFYTDEYSVSQNKKLVE